MSAFTLEGDHIDLLVTAAIRISGWEPRYINVPETADTIGQDLLNENFASVNYRYTEDTPVPEYHWTPVAEVEKGELTAAHYVQILHAADCYHYQSCEHPSWSDSKAYWTTQAIRLWAIGHLNRLRVPKEPAYQGGPLRFRGESEAEWVWARSDGFKTAEEAA